MVKGLSHLTTLSACHYSNTSGSAMTLVASGFNVTPPDPMSGRMTQQDYPFGKLYQARQCFTTYAAFNPGDRLRVSGSNFAVKVVNPWSALDNMSAYYELWVEYDLGS